MRAAVLRAPRVLTIETVEAPAPGPGEVLVRVGAAGICGTDYRIWTGERAVRHPLIPGHEFIGEVAGVGPGVGRVAVGQRVAVEPNWGCGACDLCREGSGNLCLQRTAVGIDRAGGFAELAVLPERACWPAPTGVTDERLLLTEPLAVVVRAVTRATPRAGESAAVVGAGTLGLLALQVLRARGCRVLVVSRTDRRLGLARALGAEAIVALGTGDPVAAARAFSGRDGVDLAIETAGTAAAVEFVLGQAGFVRPGGRVVLTGLPHEPARVEFFWLVRREIDVRGSMIYQQEFGEALGLLAQGAVDVAPLVTHRFPLERLEEALATHRRPEAIKVAVFPRPEGG
ncbi:MAG: alcohol dehydrogenase catalytic domain-containing protein [Candidatus Rokubacteria bacterium]|nr:alcohol dehydrogenase catalytic domain-containing protein [Candidatus Rokubacteria bacterium]